MVKEEEIYKHVEKRVEEVADDIIKETLALYFLNHHKSIIIFREIQKEEMTKLLIDIIPAIRIAKKFGKNISVKVYAPIIVKFSTTSQSNTDENITKEIIIASIEGNNTKEYIIYRFCDAGITPIISSSAINEIVNILPKSRLEKWCKYIKEGNKDEIFKELSDILSKVVHDDVTKSIIYIIPLKLIDCLTCHKEKCNKSEETLMSTLMYGTYVIIHKHSIVCNAETACIPLSYIYCFYKSLEMIDNVAIIKEESITINSFDDVENIATKCLEYLSKKKDRCEHTKNNKHIYYIG